MDRLFETHITIKKYVAIPMLSYPLYTIMFILSFYSSMLFDCYFFSYSIMFWLNLECGVNQIIRNILVCSVQLSMFATFDLMYKANTNSTEPGHIPFQSSSFYTLWFKWKV